MGFMFHQALGTLALYQSPRAVEFFALVCMIAAAFFLWYNKQNVYFLPFAITTALGTVFGVFCGLYNFDVYYIFVEFYKNSMVYNDLVPSMNSRAVIDAGRLSFAPDSFVDVARSVGFTHA